MADPSRSSWDRFQELLEGLQPGDELQVAAASRDTGLSRDMCEHVLEALVRVDIFTRVSHEVFLRRRIFEALERLEGSGR
jgi:hypothetical protein